MKLISFLILSCLWAYNATSQSISRDVWAAGGNFFSSESVSVDWTIGETITEYSSNSKNNLSGGFQLEQRLIDLCGGNCYELVGRVHAGNDLVSNGTIILIDSSSKWKISLPLSDGHFKFKQTFPGKYTFLAVPGTGYMTFSPTYYVNKLSLNSANFIQVRSAIDSLDLYLIELGSKIDSKAVARRFVVYPNPAVDYINIGFNSELEEGKMYIINTFGQQVWQNTNSVKQSMHSIDVSFLSPGIYTVIFRSDLIVLTKKFVKI